MRVAFLWWWPVCLEDLVCWSDGLHGALIRTGWDIDVYTAGPINNFRSQGLMFHVRPSEKFVIKDLQDTRYDAVLAHGSLDRPLWPLLDQVNIPRKALCFAGGTPNHQNRDVFTKIFVETQFYVDLFNDQRVERAFGVDTDIFFPQSNLHPIFPAIFPASYVRHKRFELLPERTLTVGRIEDPSVVRSDCVTLPRVTPSVLNTLYNLSQCTIIPGGLWSGSERVVLESFATGTPVIVAQDNLRCREFVDASGCGLVVEPTKEAFREAVLEVQRRSFSREMFRDFLQRGLTSAHYAQKLRAWLEG